jgi:hypothetical protein
MSASRWEPGTRSFSGMTRGWMVSQLVRLRQPCSRSFAQGLRGPGRCSKATLVARGCKTLWARSLSMQSCNSFGCGLLFRGRWWSTAARTPSAGSSIPQAASRLGLPTWHVSLAAPLCRLPEKSGTPLRRSNLDPSAGSLSRTGAGPQIVCSEGSYRTEGCALCASW